MLASLAADVRLALGESPGRALRRTVGDTLRPAALGVGAGVLLALAGGRLLARVIVGANAHDWPTLAAASLGLLAIVAAVAARPARWASRIDPATALRDG